jgi:hypothetical protein
MSRRLFAVIASVLLVPATSFALLIGGGKEPLAEGNYRDWPGLADVVNDASRVSWSWCNGSEWLLYRGDAAALNRVLREFAEVEAEQRPVVLLPFTPRTAASDGAKQKFTEPDWKLHIVKGAVRSMHRRWGIESVDDLHPTLWVSVSERLPLNELEIPDNIRLLQTADIRRDYENGIRNGRERGPESAREALERFDSAIPQDGPAAEEYQARLAAIDEFVRQHAAAKPAE